MYPTAFFAKKLSFNTTIMLESRQHVTVFCFKSTVTKVKGHVHNEKERKIPSVSYEINF